MTTIRLEPIRIPGGLFDPAAFRRVVRNVRAARAADIEVDFNTTTATWSNSPKANVEFIGDGEAKIFMLDDRYGWVNDGTRAHVIRPRNVSRLVFQANYRSKTIGGFIVNAVSRFPRPPRKPPMISCTSNDDARRRSHIRPRLCR